MNCDCCQNVLRDCFSQIILETILFKCVYLKNCLYKLKLKKCFIVLVVSYNGILSGDLVVMKYWSLYKLVTLLQRYSF